LLSNYPRLVNQPYVKWLGQPATLHDVTLKILINYSRVFDLADEVLRQIRLVDQAWPVGAAKRHGLTSRSSLLGNSGPAQVATGKTPTYGTTRLRVRESLKAP
jgi:hypothetical protein